MPRAPHPFSRHFAAVSVIAIAISCSPALTPPNALVRNRLSFDAPAAGLRADGSGPLRVVFGAPQGETQQVSEVSLVFSKPVRALSLEPDQPPPPVHMHPTADGAWQWLGSTALRFNARSPLPYATTYTVTVPAGTKSLDGDTLSKPFELTFSTPRPALTSTAPERDADGVRPDERITLWFNQPIAPEEARRAVSLDARGALPFRVLEELPSREVHLQPTKPLPLGADVTLRVAPSLRGVEGDLAANQEAIVRFKTVRPLAAKGFQCDPHKTEKGACDPLSQTVTFVLNNPIAGEKALRHFVLTPTPDDLSIASDGDETTDRFSISASFTAGTTYTFRFRARIGRDSIRDEFGQKLASDAITTLRFGDAEPEVRFGARGTYWTDSTPHQLPVGGVNAHGIEVKAALLDPAGVLAMLTHTPHPISFSTSRTPVPDGDRNSWQNGRIALDTLLTSPSVHGAVLVQASYLANGVEGTQTATREFQMTEMGLVTRAGPNDGLVWLTGLTDGKPISGVALEVFGIPRKEGSPANRLATATTDAQGLASFALPPSTSAEESRYRQLAVFARSATDRAYLTLRTPRPLRPTGFVFDDRGLYRPGETVHLAGAFRIPSTGGLTTPAGRRVRIEARGPKGTLRAWEVTLSPFGTFSTTLLVPQSAALGFYYVVASLDGGEARDRFRVEEYQPLTSTLDVNTDRPTYRRGDTLRCNLTGTYLHGGPMAGAAARIEVTRSSGWYTVPGLDGYSIRDLDAVTPEGVVTRAEPNLGGAGSASLPVRLDLPGQVGTEEVHCNVELTDVDRRVQASAASAIVHPGEVYVALKTPEQWVYRPGESVVAKALVVTPEGERRALPVHIDLLLRHYLSDGRPQDKQLAGCDARPGQQPAMCQFRAPLGNPKRGAYLLLRATVTDTQGRSTSAAYERQLEAPPKVVVAVPTPPPPPAPPQLEITGANDPFHVGDTAHLKLESPFSVRAEALVTVEREGVLAHRIVQLPARGLPPATFDLKVTREMIPNVRVNVVAISGQSSRKESADLEIKPDSQELTVRVTPTTLHAAPGDTIDVTVDVTDSAGKPALGEVTLWAADEGSLILAGYRHPDPIQEMFDYASVLVEGADARESLVVLGSFGSHRSRPPTVRMGATSVEPRRGDFRQTVFFASHLVTDASGRVRKRVKLPDGLTTYRLMAVAIARDDRFGAAQTQVITSKPLMAVPTLPRVIRAGDQFEASVIVSTHDLPSTNGWVTAAARGLVAIGPSRKSLRLPPDQPVEVRFPFRAVQAGEVQFTVDARAMDASDGVVLRSVVVAPAVMEATAAYGQTERAIAERLPELSSARPDVGELTVSVSSTPLAGLATSMHSLQDYPYGCTEQTVSRMLPMLLLRDLAAALGMKLPDGTLAEPGSGRRATGDVYRVLRSATAEIVSNQRSDGGFGFWPQASSSHPWVTAYALWGLTEANARGIPVHERVIDRARAYLLAEVGEVSNPSLGADELAVAAFTLDILALQGRVDESLATGLFARRKELPVFAKALLLHAIATSEHDAHRVPRVEALMADLASTIRIDGNAAHVVTEQTRFSSLLDSSARTTAMVLRAIMAAAPEHPMAARLVRGLLDDRTNGVWRTTQETAFALVALDAYRRVALKARQAFGARVFLGPDLLLEGNWDEGNAALTSTVSVPMARLLATGGRPLTFAIEGRGTLHYETRLRFARTQLPSLPVEAGIFVRKIMRPMDAYVDRRGGSLVVQGGGELRFPASQLVLCEIEVVTPTPRKLVVIDDPLPGGFEAIHFGLRMGGEWLERLDWGSRPSAGELRDDRVVLFVDTLPAGIWRYRYLARARTIGRFVMPPTRVEEMYVPETYGTTPSSIVQITAP